MKIGEVYDVVDKDGNKISEATWEEVHTKGLLHNNVHGILFKDSSRKETLLKKRSNINPQEAGSIEIAVAGHVPSGLTPQKAIEKEIREELLGNENLPADLKIQKKGKYFNHDIPSNFEIAYLFEIIYAGPFQVSEESEGKPYWIRWDELLKDIKLNPRKYAQYSINAIEFYNKNKG